MLCTCYVYTLATHMGLFVAEIFSSGAGLALKVKVKCHARDGHRLFSDSGCCRC